MERAIERQSPAQQRRDALAPLIEQFGLLGGDKDRLIQQSISLGGHQLELGAWERHVLRLECSEGQGEEDRSAGLLAECMAFQARCRTLLDLFENGPMPPPAELPAFLGRLVTDVAVGLALQEELQRDMNELIRAGELADAKHLTAFRTKIVQCVAMLKERVGSATVEQAERRAKGLISPEEEAEEGHSLARRPKARLLEEAEPDAPTWEATHAAARYKGKASAPVPRVRRKPRSRLKPMLLFLALLIGAWAVFVLPGLQSTGPPLLKLERFRHLDPVEGIVARPPSLFVKLDADEWRELSPDGRRELIEEIAAVADQAGYFGVHAGTTEGVAVGQWLKQTGVRLLATAPGGAT